MINKAYIVDNKQQEREVLCELEQKGFVWSTGVLPTKFFPNTTIFGGEKFPYALIENDRVSWADLSQLTDEKIVFDGRKEERMSDKYVVSQDFIDELKEWKNNLVKYNEPGRFVDVDDIEGLPVVVNAWWGDEVSDEESNNRLIAIIRWVNGEQPFEVEKPKKWVVRSKEHDEGGHYQYVKVGNFDIVFNKYNIDQSTRFDTKEEAESWANSHQEVVQVEVD